MTDKYLIPNLDEINAKLELLNPDEIIRSILNDIMPAAFGEGFSSLIATSGGSKSVLLPYYVMASVPEQDIPLVFVDHYFHTNETYVHIEKIEHLFGNIRRYFPMLSRDEMAGMGFPPEPVSQEDFMKDDAETIDKIMKFTEFQYYAKGEPTKRFLDEYKTSGHALLVFNGRTRYQAEKGRDKLKWLEYSGNGIFRAHPLLRHSGSQILADMKRYGLPVNENHIDPAKGINLECSLNTVR